MNPHYEKALHLFRVSRPGEAEKELRAGLLENPNDSDSQSLLALCLSLQGRTDEGIIEAVAAVGRSPNDPYCHFIQAQVFYNAERYPEALDSIKEALRLNPLNPDYFYVLSIIHYAQKDWTQALEAAESGLKEDSEHVDCHIAQARALSKLGRSREAVANSESAIRLEPERAATHAAQGWAYLEQNKTAEAMQCFREALRIEPNMEWARQGILHAMKARNPLYAVMLMYFLWMAKLKKRLQWGVVLGAYAAYQGIRILGNNYPALRPYTHTLMIAYLAFCIFSWIAVPLFNFILRLDKFGRMALNDDEIAASNRIGGLIAACILSFTAYAVWHGGLWEDLGFFYLLLLIPVAGVFRCAPGPARKKAVWLTRGLAAVGFFGAILTGALGSNLFTVFLFGVLFSSIFFNAISAKS